MSNRLNVVAINGSPHTSGGNTSLMTQMLAPMLTKEGINLEEEFMGHIVIADGQCSYVPGLHSNPDVTIDSSADVWLAVSNGEITGQAAFMSGKYVVDGDLNLLMKLGNLFSK